jgi:regulator of protease activity HflC (stomatin/prohibitin superfamily)
MSSTTEGRQATMDSTQIYREETFTDRRVGTIRRLTPVGADGMADSTRQVIYVGQAQVMTPMGAVPISFELEAATLNAAIEKFGAAAEQAVQQTMRELQEIRREQASTLVIPDAAGGALPNPADLLGRGRPRR